ncbi:MAD2L1-binding protein [Narcine bancroftii]|uniref:MAD2L1-binding protein n=1 Tax=Narcine bancroftii TaxID=1343680 RepID=UPI00383219D5
MRGRRSGRLEMADSSEPVFWKKPPVAAAGPGEGPGPGVGGAGEGPGPGVGGAGEGPGPGVGGAGEGPGPGVGGAGEGRGSGVGRPGEGRGSGVGRPGEGPGSGVGRPGEEARAVPGVGAQAELPVLFPGHLTRKSCCRIVCELLKHVLYQRQQLPLPYDQLAFFSKRECGRDDYSVPLHSKRNEQNNCKKSQRMLLELDEVFKNLEAMFTLTLVPCVHILLGGSVVNPKEMYEINMEQVAFGNTEESLKTVSCIRQFFHALFIEDLFNELKSVPLMNTVLLLQAHRNCGMSWFRPKLNYRVPKRTRKLIINLACDTRSFNSDEEHRPNYNSDEYIWFQAPITIKGFNYL